MKKRAIILLNLGGPLAQADIRPFLFNFFMDKNIISAPLPLRFLLALWISWSRGRGAARAAYAALGFRSPLLDNTRAQARALEAMLPEGDRVFVCMRYWHPMSDAAAAAVKEFAPEEIVLLPLYPQFSTATTASSFAAWDRAAQAAGLDVPTRRVCCWPEDGSFVAASAARIAEVMRNAPEGTRLLFSAHGLPERVIAAGDPYQWQCEQTAAAIALAAGAADWRLCYQSRVGPLKWTGPSTEEALGEAAADGKGVVIYPLAFVSEHVETLVEIDVEYRHLAKTLGIPYFAKAETVGTHPDFIAGLAALAAREQDNALCPQACRRCYRRT